MRRKDEQGFLLLEVLIAISILAIGATASIRVIGEAFHAEQKLSQLQTLRTLMGDIVCHIQMGESPQLFRPEGGDDSGKKSIHEMEWDYEIQSVPYQRSKKDYEIHIILNPANDTERITRQTFFMRKPENL